MKRVIFCIALFVFLRGAAVYAEHDPLRGLQGKPFTDPSKQMEMPESWKKEPIKYDPTSGSADLVIALDQQMYPLLLTTIQKYAKEQGLKIHIIEGTCGVTAGKVLRKAVDIGGLCCPPGETDRVPGLRFHTLGITPVALLVHTDNPVDNITTRQAQQIFKGEIRRWSELKTVQGAKGQDMPIQPVTRLHCKTRPVEWSLLLKDESLFSPRKLEVGAIPDMLATVSERPEAIGYETMWMVQLYKGKVKALKIDGCHPEELSCLVSGRYPIHRTYTLSTWEGKGLVNPHAKKLVDYLFKYVETLDKRFGVIPASQLKQAGWKFKDEELVGKP